ncbi:hypothetical protein F4778DRAFT_722332 [Xylariomycetidae sp. FL2044]|nr:hypothetical protein F4778DRAFT_722332 [Xylariomycetidae sp. FL2044]
MHPVLEAIIALMREGLTRLTQGAVLGQKYYLNSRVKSALAIITLILGPFWPIRIALRLLGFHVLGPTAGSVAAGWQATYGGLVPAGGIFAFLQRLGMILTRGLVGI